MAIEQQGGNTRPAAPGLVEDVVRAPTPLRSPTPARRSLNERFSTALSRRGFGAVAVETAEPVSPHTVIEPTPTAPASRARSHVRIGLATTAGLAGSVLMVGTSPVWRLAPNDTWRLTIPGLNHPGDSLYSGFTFVIAAALMALGWVGLVGHVTRVAGVTTEPDSSAWAGFAGRGGRVVLGVTMLWALPFMLGPIQISTDAYSYSAQGMLANIGKDPSVVGPNALPNHGTSDYWRAADPIWRDSPAPYGPVAVLTEKLAVGLSDFDVARTVLGLRFLAMAGVAMSAVGVYLIARSHRVSEPMALAVAIANPVVLVHLIGGAHNDALMMGLLLLGLASFERSRKILAVVLIALAIGVKLPAIVALGFIAWNWKGKDAEWRARLLSFPVVGAIAALVIGALSVVVGTKLGWITALSGTGKVYSTFSVFTKVGFLFSDLLNGVGLNVDPFVVADAFRLVGLISAAVIITTLMVKSPKLGITKSVGLALLVLILFGPVVWPWYLPVGFALLAAVGMRRFRPTMIVLIISASLLVWPTSVNPIDRLSRYQHWLGLAVVLLIAGLCVAAESLARYAEARAGLLDHGGLAIDAVLVGPAETDEFAGTTVPVA